MASSLNILSKIVSSKVRGILKSDEEEKEPPTEKELEEEEKRRKAKQHIDEDIKGRRKGRRSEKNMGSRRRLTRERISKKC